MENRVAYTKWVCALLIVFGAGLLCDNMLLAQTDSTGRAPAPIVSKKKKKKKKKQTVQKQKDSLASKSADSLKREIISAKKHLSKRAPKKSIREVPPLHFNPTTSGAPGSVKSYFFPNKLGASWKMRTVQLLFDDSNKLVRADTVFSVSKVIDTARFSLQRLPLMVTADSSYKPGGKGGRAESVFYVDDSIAMTVFNNSVSHGENHLFLVAPVKLRNAWHLKLDDTTITMIAGFGDSLMTPMGKMSHILVTLSQQDYSDMRTYFVPGYGIVKTIYRSVGPGGKGLVIITSEMMEFTLPGEKQK